MPIHVWECELIWLFNSGFSTCTRRPGLPPELPFNPDPWCRSPYTTARPDLQTPLTAVVIYCEPYDHRLDSSFNLWCQRVGHRSTTTIANEWPALQPANSVPRAVSASHLVIRWREGDITSRPVAPSPTPGREKPSAPPDDPTQTCTSGTDCPPNAVPPPSSPLPPPPPLSTAPDRFRSVLPGLVVGVLLAVLGLSVAIVFYRKRMRRKAAFRGIEIEDIGPNIGCRVLHEGIVMADDETVAEPTAE